MLAIRKVESASPFAGIAGVGSPCGQLVDGPSHRGDQVGGAGDGTLEVSNLVNVVVVRAEACPSAVDVTTRLASPSGQTSTESSSQSDRPS